MQDVSSFTSYRQTCDHGRRPRTESEAQKVCSCGSRIFHRPIPYLQRSLLELQGETTLQQALVAVLTEPRRALFGRPRGVGIVAGHNLRQNAFFLSSKFFHVFHFELGGRRALPIGLMSDLPAWAHVTRPAGAGLERDLWVWLPGRELPLRISGSARMHLDRDRTQSCCRSGHSQR